MQIETRAELPRSEAIAIVIAVSALLAAAIWLLPPAPPSVSQHRLPFDSAELLITGTLTVALLVVVAALPLAFLSAVFIHVLPEVSKRRMFAILLILAQSPLFLWGFAASIPLLASAQMWPVPALVGYFSAILGILSFPRLTVQILSELEAMPEVWQETIIGLGASARQLYWTLILPAARSASFRHLFAVMGSAMTEAAVSLLILGPTVTLAADISGGLIGRGAHQMLLNLSTYKLHLLFLVFLHMLTQLGARWRLQHGGGRL